MHIDAGSRTCRFPQRGTCHAACFVLGNTAAVTGLKTLALGARPLASLNMLHGRTEADS